VGNVTFYRPENISTSMTSALDLWNPKSIENIFLSWVAYMYGMVTLSENGNIIEP
jgi:hypothetical protein